VFLHSIHQTESRSLPNRTASPGLNEPACRAPLSENYSVRQWCAAADHTSWCFDIGAMLQQGIESVHIIATGGPV
jgi:hypothetical protein